MPDTPSPLTPAEIAQFLRATTLTLAAELAAVPPRALAWHPAPGEWCAKDVIGHLTEAERRGFAGRIRMILAGQDPKVDAWDPDEVARARGDCERDAAGLLNELAALRQDSLQLVQGLRDVDLARGGLHPKVGYLTVGEIINEWVHHDRNHVRQILANVQAYVWPHMGTTQRFSAP
jgi:DinB superfamily